LQRLLKEAIRILDEQGLEAVSMRALAERLSVTPMSLYRYCESHDALLDRIHDELLAMHAPRPLPADASWREAATELARCLRRTFAAHPNAVMLFAARPRMTHRLAPHVDAALGRLVTAGFDLGIAMTLLEAVTSYSIGRALNEFDQRGGAKDQLLRALPSLPNEPSRLLPYLEQWLARERPRDVESEFIVGLVALLDGFAHRYAKRHR
jgi:AcrR family transcriptional regulator